MFFATFCLPNPTGSWTLGKRISDQLHCQCHVAAKASASARSRCVCVCATNTLENRDLEQCAASWCNARPCGSCCQIRRRGGRVGSRLGAMVTELLIEPHNRRPFRGFLRVAEHFMRELYQNHSVLSLTSKFSCDDDPRRAASLDEYVTAHTRRQPCSSCQHVDI